MIRRFLPNAPLPMNPAAIRHYVPASITYLLNSIHDYRAGYRSERTLEIRAHHAFILGVYGGSIHLVHLPIDACNNASRMLLLYGRFVFEINVARCNKDKRQDQRDHYVVMEAPPRI